MDRGKSGSKHHVLTDANGVPLAVTTTAANTHDVVEAIHVVASVPPVQGKRGRPKTRPKSLVADKAYDSQDLRVLLRWLGIHPEIPKRGDDSRGLGQIRWAVERTIAWLHQFKRLRTRYDRRHDIHEAFTSLAAAIICWKLFC